MTPKQTDNKPTEAGLAHKRSYQAPRLVRYGALRDLTQAGGTSTNEGSVRNRSTGGSAVQLKTSIVRIGTHPLGFGLYLFDYKDEYKDLWGHGRQFGVMAHEVETIVPDAVSQHQDGYKVVDYAMLGIARTKQ
jgi:hypothetical protein